MSTFLYFAFLFFVKVLDNALGTARTLLVQRGKSVLAGLVLGVSTFLGLWITKDIVNSEGFIPILVVSLAAFVGCTLAVWVSDRFSRERTYVNVIMSDDVEAMKKFRDFLVQHKVTNTVVDSYALDWSKTLTLTAYAETKEQSRLIDGYIRESDTKFKRVVQDKVIRGKRKGKRLK